MAWLFASIVLAYLGLGLVFGAWFVVAGAGRLDPAARSASVGFRLTILPGAVLLWPLLLAKSRAAGSGSGSGSAVGGTAP